SALILLALAAADLPPPPVEEAEVPLPPQSLVEHVAEPALPVTEPDVLAQASFVAAQALHGAWLGLNGCGALACYRRASPGVELYLAPALAGAGVGFGLSFLHRDLARDWGRAALLDSGSVAAALAGLYAAGRADFLPTMEARYGVAILADLLVTAG